MKRVLWTNVIKVAQTAGLTIWRSNNGFIFPATYIKQFTNTIAKFLCCYFKMYLKNEGFQHNTVTVWES